MDINIYPRKCSVTGEPMTEGYCVFDGQYYAKDQESLSKVLLKLGYSDADEAYDEGVYYWTEWYDEISESNEDSFYTQSGKEYSLQTKTGKAVLLFANGKYKEALAIFSTFRMDFTKEQKETVKIAYECMTGNDSFYKMINIDPAKKIEEAKKIIVTKYN